MEKDFIDRIKEIIVRVECPKGFKCVNSNFQDLCEANDLGLEGYIECLEENRRECPFALSFGFGFFCECPLRIYITKNINQMSKSFAHSCEAGNLQ